MAIGMSTYLPEKGKEGKSFFLYDGSDKKGGGKYELFAGTDLSSVPVHTKRIRHGIEIPRQQVSERIPPGRNPLSATGIYQR